MLYYSNKLLANKTPPLVTQDLFVLELIGF